MGSCTSSTDKGPSRQSIAKEAAVAPPAAEQPEHLPVAEPTVSEPPIPSEPTVSEPIRRDRYGYDICKFNVNGVESEAEHQMLRAAYSLLQQDKSQAVGSAWKIPVLRAFLLGCSDPSSILSPLRDAHRMRELICGMALLGGGGLLNCIRYELFEGVANSSCSLSTNADNSVTIKLLVVGDGAIGKVCLPAFAVVIYSVA